MKLLKAAKTSFSAAERHSSYLIMLFWDRKLHARHHLIFLCQNSPQPNIDSAREEMLGGQMLP